MKYTEDIYIKYDPFLGDRDVKISCHTRKIVRIRKEHDCVLADLIGEPHKISIGERAILDKAIVDGEWGSCYACINCMDKWLSEDVGIPCDEKTFYNGEGRSIV